MVSYLAMFMLFISTTVAASEIQTNQVTNTESAYFAGGCFWCMESPFEKLPGVKEVISGYAGGKVKSPTYKQVASGQTQHREAVKVTFDPSKVSYDKLLSIFWRNIDPTDEGGQFVDRGRQYSPAIWFTNPEQKRLATISKNKLSADKQFKKNIVTPILPFTTFFPAEDYHQDYYKKNPIRYRYYRYNSGRDQFLDRIWKKSE